MLFLQQLVTPDVIPATGFSTGFFIRLGLDLLTVSLLIRLVYYRIYRKADLFLTFFTFNLIIFLVTFLLNQIQMSIGAAFGLFAVFSMLRYRTEGLSAKDMTYLFVVISVGLISAVSLAGWTELGLINGLILLTVYLLESDRLFRREYSKSLLYDRIDLIVPEKRPELLLDLRLRTGLPIHRVDIREMDFLKDAARLIIYYHQDSLIDEKASADRVSESVAPFYD